MVEPRVKVRGMELTEAMSNYCKEKIAKYDYLLEKATEIVFELFQLVSHRGVEHDFMVTIEVKVPNSLIFVEEKGSNLYALIDKLTDRVARKLKRYKDKFKNWEGENLWESKNTENIEDLENVEEMEDLESYADYVPQISSRKQVEETMPMHEAEAIERMELSNKPAYLFKKIETGNWAIVYRTLKGYEVIET